MCPLRGLVRSDISPSTQMDGKVPSRIAFTWPVNSLTETGRGGVELNAYSFNQWGLGMSHRSPSERVRFQVRRGDSMGWAWGFAAISRATEVGSNQPAFSTPMFR